MSPWRSRLLLLLGALLLFGSGVALGRFGRSSTSTVESSVVANESSGLDLRKHEVVETKPTTKVETRIVYRDGPVQERIVTREVAAGSVATTDTNVVAHSESHTVVKEVTKTDDRPFRAGALFAVHGQGKLYGAYVGMRLVGPVEVSAMAAGGQGWMAGVGLGVRF